MKLLIAISALILAVSGRIFNDPLVQKYANSAETYQSGLEQQQNGLYSGQSNKYGGQEVGNHRPEGEKTAKILAFNAEIDGHQYRYAYETENGIKAQEEGKIEKGTSAHGAFSYKGDDGHEYTVSYTADENGFRPSGDHLPTPPPIPEEILKSLEKNAKDEAAGIFDDGNYRQHQDQGHHKHQQIEGGHQSVEYHSSGHSGADLSYNAQAGAQYSNSGSGESSGHSSASSAYFTPSSHFGTSSGQKSSLSQGADSGYESSGYTASLGYQPSSSQDSSLGHQYFGHNLGYQASSGNQPHLSYQASKGNEANLGYQASSGNEANLGYQASSGNEANLGYQASSGNEANLGYQASSGNEANFGYQSSSGNAGNVGHQYSESHGAMDHQTALGHGLGYSSGSYVYRVPSGFTPNSSHGATAGHVSGLRYLPPSSHSGSGYHSHQ